MKAPRQNRGSVLMEFIIVFPIYLVLFAGVFMVGDILVHTARLPSAERTLAFGVQDDPVKLLSWDLVKNVLFRNSGDRREISDAGAQQDALSDARTPSTWYAADRTVDFPFTLRAAVKVRDDYLLPAGGVAGQLMSANWFLGEGIKQTSPLDGDVLSLAGGNRVSMYSKSESGGRVRYNYYTLKRTRYPGTETWRDNRRYASDLLAHSGKKQVWRQMRDERFHETVNDETNDKNQGAYWTERCEYQRYGRFVTWSE